MNYETPEMEVIELENRDVVVASEVVAPLPGDDHYPFPKQ